MFKSGFVVLAIVSCRVGPALGLEWEAVLTQNCKWFEGPTAIHSLVLCLLRVTALCLARSVHQQVARSILCLSYDQTRRTALILGAFAKSQEKRLLASSCVSVRTSAWNDAAPTGRILMKFDIYAFSENLPRKFQVSLKCDEITGTLHEDVSTFVTISRWIIFKMISISDKSCRENQNACFMFRNCLAKIVPFMR